MGNRDDRCHHHLPEVQDRVPAHGVTGSAAQDKFRFTVERMQKKGSQVELKTIHCFLVHPSKREETQPSIGGTAVPKRGRMFDMLKEIFDQADTNCPTDISFMHDSGGNAKNECRELLLAYVMSHKVDDGRKVALRLQGVTTLKSGMGLLFLMLGQEDGKTRLVLSRFPADQGISAEERKDSLNLEFLEKVFMKSATAYKSAVFSGKSDLASVWFGRAVDRQINSPGDQIAHYWIRDFLASALRTTAAAGTKRLAVALRTAIQGLSDAEAKSEIAAAVTLIGGVAGMTITGEQFCSQFGLSPEATNAIRSAFKDDKLMKESFKFDAGEFKRHIAFRSVELNNGGILTAEASRFDEVFTQEPAGQADGEVRITTQGRVVDERLRKAKA